MERQAWKLSALGIVLMLFLLSCGLGCASKEEKKAEHLERAKAYLAESEYKKAVIELKNVVQLDPKDDAAHYQLGETYLRLKQAKEAFQSFSRAASVNPDNLEAQLKLGQMFLLGRNTDEAREKAERILDKSPDHVEALGLLSGVQIQEKDVDSAVATLQKASEIDPKHFKTQLSLGRLFFLKRDLDAAEQSYIRAIALDPKSRVPYIELSRIYIARKEWDRAEAELKKMIQVSGATSQNLQILGRFYEGRGRWDEAEKQYKEAAAAAPEGEVAPLMNLSAYYARRNAYDQALQVMEEASSIKKEDLNIQVSMAQLHFDFQKIEKSEALLDVVLTKDSGHVMANFLKGRILLSRRDYAGALDSFNGVIEAQPKNASALYFRALCLLGKGDSRLAQQDLLKAVELNPRLVDARLMLADLYIREREKDLAREQLNTALRLAPGHIRALTLDGNLKMLEQDTSGAEEAYKQVIAAAPDYAPGYVRLAVLYNLTKKPDDALKNLEKALEINPLQTDALGLIVSAYLREKKFDQAREICRTQKEKVRGHPSHLALTEFLEGNVFLAEGDTKQATDHFKKAIDTDPNILSPYLALARIYAREGKPEDVVSQYEAILQKRPDYLPAYMALGSLYDLQGKRKKAEPYYRKALEIKEDFAPAANNLAWNLVLQDGNIDEALGFAQIAKENMPQSAAIMDTLGWIYYLKGRYLSAVSELQDSAGREPNNPVINYHLGMAYFRNNQPDLAKEFLNKALKLDPDFEGSEEARKALEALEASASG